MNMKEYQRQYYLKNKDKKRDYYRNYYHNVWKKKQTENEKRQYIKSGEYTKEQLEKKQSFQKEYKNPYVDKPTENIIYEDKRYIYLKDKIYSKSQFHFIMKHTRKKDNKLYSIINKNVYNKDIKNMELSNNYVRYFF